MTKQTATQDNAGLVERPPQGSAGDAIDFALGHCGPEEALAFLDDWRTDRANEWPGYMKWLEVQYRPRLTHPVDTAANADDGLADLVARCNPGFMGAVVAAVGKRVHDAEMCGRFPEEIREVQAQRQADFILAQELADAMPRILSALRTTRETTDES